MVLLQGHVSPETAYEVHDYPYGFRLRCKIRYWIETKGGKDRLVSQTTNPKNGYWNKPKAGVYCYLIVMYLDEKGHVAHSSVSPYFSPAQFQEFETKYGADFTEDQKKRFAVLKSVHQRYNPKEWAEWNGRNMKQL